jgi:hypothetical protein
LGKGDGTHTASYHTLPGPFRGDDSSRFSPSGHPYRHETNRRRATGTHEVHAQDAKDEHGSVGMNAPNHPGKSPPQVGPAVRAFTPPGRASDAQPPIISCP